MCVDGNHKHSNQCVVGKALVFTNYMPTLGSVGVKLVRGETMEKSVCDRMGVAMWGVAITKSSCHREPERCATPWDQGLF